MKYLRKPHFYAHVISSIFLVLSIVLLALNCKKVMKLDVVEQVKILLILAIIIAIHGQGHTILEKEYGYDPISLI